MTSEKNSNTMPTALSDIKIDLPPIFIGDGTEDFARWCRRLEVAVNASQKFQYDRRLRYEGYNCGDLVWVDLPRNKRLKLAPKWEGPFIVIKALENDGDGPPVVFQVRDLGNPLKPLRTLHYNRLKPYRSSNVGSRNLKSCSPIPPLASALSGSLPQTPQGMGTGIVEPTAPVQEQVMLVPEPSSETPVEPVVQQGELGDQQPRTRSGRQVRLPVRFRDFNMSS